MRHIAHVVHEHFLWLLLGAYALAATAPSAGLALRALSLGHLSWVDGSHVSLGLPTLLLSFLLFNAGLGVRVAELRQLLGAPRLLLAGLLLNSALPILVTLLFQLGLGLWHNDEEARTVILSLALIISMPIAGSSTAWAQNASGNVALSLGLVVASTLLSPLTSPVALALGASLAEGSAADARAFTAEGMGASLVYVIVLPSVLGLLGHAVLGEARVQRLRTHLKLLNAATILSLNYINGSAALPGLVAKPDWDYLVLVLGLTLALCSACFATGWHLPRLFGADRDSRVSMMYGIGMNNNGSALVLASVVMSQRPMILVPILVYNLVQHMVGAIAIRAVGESPAPA